MDTTTLEWAIIQSRPPANTDSETGKLANQLLKADFKAILTSPVASRILHRTPALWDGLIATSPANSGTNGSTTDVEEIDPVARVVVAVALLHSFVQSNWTGPSLDFTPLDLLPPSASPSSSKTPSLEDLSAAALPLLTLQGEPAYHLCSHPALLVLSNRLFESLSNAQVPTLPWWKLRLHLIHLSLLDDPVSLPEKTLQELQDLAKRIPGDERDLLALLHLEMGLYHHALDQDKAANASFLDAARSAGLEYELTGAMGKRTKFQVEAHSQLVLLAESRHRPDDDTSVFTASSASDSLANGTSSMPESLPLLDDTLLEETEFTKSSTSQSDGTSRLAHLDPASQPPLHPLDQSLLLCMCLAQHNQSPETGLTASQMMPFITRVLAHARNWSVHTTALLLRSRLESARSRTVERATLQLAALIEQMPTTDSSVAERLKFFHQLPLPAKWQMEKELAKRYISLGVSRSALEIYYRLEMWEDVVACLQRMDREEEAEKIVRDLLDGKIVESDVLGQMRKTTISETRKSNLTKGRLAKLWCLLGDLSLANIAGSHDPAKAREIAKEYYNHAWEVSANTSSRAMRSLGTLYFKSGDFESAIEKWKAALAINPQYARVWFTLGVSYVRLEKWSEARDAFKREVGVDDEDSEGWNNLAAVYLRLGEEGLPKDQPPPPVSFENKLLAFRALRQGLRYAYHNWRMWQNYVVISMDVGELSETVRAMTRVIEETATTASGSIPIDYDVLDRLVDAVSRDDWSLRDLAVPKTSNQGLGLWPLVERLFDVVILPRISDDPRIWTTHARLLRWKEDWIGAQEDYLRAYRSGPVSATNVERELGKWKEAVQEIEELVAVLSFVGPKAVAQKEAGEGEGGKKKGDWRFQARGIVRTFMGRTRDSFEDQPEWAKLQEVLDDLKKTE